MCSIEEAEEAGEDALELYSGYRPLKDIGGHLGKVTGFNGWLEKQQRNWNSGYKDLRKVAVDAKDGMAEHMMADYSTPEQKVASQKQVDPNAWRRNPAARRSSSSSNNTNNPYNLGDFEKKLGY